MIEISEEDIQQSSLKLASIPPGKQQTIIEKFSKDQPYILAYVLAMSEELESEEQKQLLLYLATVIWQACKINTPSMTRITEKILDETDKLYFDNISGTSSDEADKFVESFLRDINQPSLLAFVSGTLVDPEENDILNDLSRTMIFSVLNIIIKCFNDNINGAKRKIVR